jgi:mono/diheme cytochrome c family protein
LNARRTTAALFLGVTVALGVLPPILGARDLPTAQHHLVHSALIAGAVVAGVLFAVPSRDTRAGHYGWLLLTTLAPIAAMLLMWPSEYAWFELHPAGHAAEHLGLVGLGFVAGYAGQRYAAGIGWASGLSLFAMAFASAWGFGVAPASAIAASVPPQAAEAGAAVAGPPDPARGQTLFAQNCAACHGVGGGGGQGPSLLHERERKNFTLAVQWIIDPAPPMPKLYPASISRTDVRDIAAYVEQL